MEQVNVGASKNNRVFLGKGWKNTSKNGTEYLNISFDRGMEVVVRDKAKGVEYVLAEGAQIAGFPNTKREGKKDADLRFSFQVK